MIIDKKAINYYYSFFEVSKELNQKQFYDFNMAIYKVMFFETHINDVTFNDQMLTILWKSVKHSVQASVKGYCDKKSIPYDECFTPLTNPLDNKQEGQEKGEEQGQEEEKGEEQSNSVTVIPEKSLAHKTIDYLNQQVGKQFKYVESNLKHINGRIKEGATEKELSYVIDVKVKEWSNDAKMKQFLRPSTLFTPSNFDKYLNQDVAVSGSEEVGFMLDNNIFDMIDEMEAQTVDNNERIIK